MSNRILLQYPPLEKWLLQPTDQKVRGLNAEGHEVTYNLRALLGVGGKGAVFRATKEGDLTQTAWVLKFPTFDFTYIDSAMEVEDSLKKLKRYLESQEAEYKEDYLRSKRLLDDCEFAHRTIDLVGCTYRFSDGTGPTDVPVSLRVGVQELLERTEWRPLDDWVLPKLNEAPLNLQELPNIAVSYESWLQLAKGIAKAIKEIHDRRVVHGDIWAPNVFLAVRHGEVDLQADPKLIDFGNSWSTEYVSAQLGGKRQDSYAPPEERRAILPKSEASDAFGYGVLLLWLLTGPEVGATNAKPGMTTDSTNSDKEVVEERKALLLAYIRRKAFDRRVRDARNEASKPVDQLDSESVSKLTDGLASQQVETLRQLFPEGNAILDELIANLGAIQHDETTLKEYLRGLLEAEYARQIRFEYRTPSKRANENMSEWEGLRWLKRRLYRPCETMIYDPGEVSIVEADKRQGIADAAKQRSLVRAKILSSKNAKAIFLKHPWSVDLISHCVSSDQARRPRMVDVLRDLDTYSSDPAVGNPLEAVSAHRLKVLELGQPSHLKPVDQLDIKDSRDVLIEYMCVCLRSLGPEDIYASVTTLDMWQGRALGHDGRYLTANLEALKAGASIRRLFIVSLEEIGSRFAVRLLVALAKQIGLELDEQDGGGDAQVLFNSLKDVREPDFTSFSNRGCSPVKLCAFECLLHHFRVALHDQVQSNITPTVPSTTGDQEHVRIAHEQRLTARTRFRLVLEAYEYFIQHFEVQLSEHKIDSIPTIYSHQFFPRDIRDTRQLMTSQGFDNATPGLFLGLRFESSLAKAIKLRASCPRAIIKSQSVIWENTNHPRYIMLETEARGRGRENILDLPELNRLRIYYSKLPVSPTVASFQKLMYGFDKGDGRNALPAVNLGCLVSDLVAVLRDMGI